MLFRVLAVFITSNIAVCFTLAVVEGPARHGHAKEATVQVLANGEVNTVRRAWGGRARDDYDYDYDASLGSADDSYDNSYDYYYASLGTGEGEHVSLADVMSCPAAVSVTACLTDANYQAISDRISGLVKTLREEHPCENDDCKVADFAGCVLRAAGHDFMDFRDNVGGSDGCIKFEDPDNKGLINCLNDGDVLASDDDPDRFSGTLHHVYSDFCGSVSLADFMVIAAEAVMASTSTDDAFALGNKFRSGFRFGRQTSSSCASNPALPNPQDGCKANEVTFRAENALNLDWRETAAVMGVHTLGKTHPQNSGYSGWWTDENNVAHFNNNYYISIVNKGWAPSTVASSGKSQWKRSDTLKDDRQLQHPEMMLNTDMCLAYKDATAESSDCCAWERFPILEEAGVNDTHEGTPIFCGFLNPFSDKIIERVWCCNNHGGQTDVPKQSTDCSVDQNGDAHGDGPAIDAVHEFAANETVWLGEFVAAWKKVTELGAAGLRALGDCP